MAKTFFFYDLETSGVNPKEARIMQFAGQRTDLALHPIGEPINEFIKITDDVVPDPYAILITGITPQKTIAEGITEAAFLRLFYEKVALKDTVFVGFNTVRFDDEFMRYVHYRNFYDPYEWHWQDGRSRWDLLDMVRLTRALRPEGIKWPFDSNGKPSNRLELLAAINGLDHANAHDALSDVQATIALARLIQNKQPKLFDYLFVMRDKKEVAKLVSTGEPFVYASGKYDSEYEKATVVTMVAEHPKKQGALVFDLRQDPTPFLQMNPEELAEAWRYSREEKDTRLPVKTLQYNRCPAVAPLGVLETASQKRLAIDLAIVQKHRKMLRQSKDFVNKLYKALAILDQQQQTALLAHEQLVDAQLYDGFITDQDKTKMSMVRAASTQELSSLAVSFKDNRLQALLPLYKARNFSSSLSGDERQEWEKYRAQKLLSGGETSRMAVYFKQLEELADQAQLSEQKKYLLEELQLYGQSIMPVSA